MNNRFASITCATALAAAFTVSLPEPVHAHQITPPAVPDKLKVEEGSKPFLQARGVGTQNYICLPSGNGFRFVLFTPQATLFANNGKQVITHFFSPNPEEDGTVRVTWQHSRDTSIVWASLIESSSDAPFVAEGAVAWLLLGKKGVQEGTGGDTLVATDFIHRVNTVGGLAPKTGCASATDVGRQEFVPYEADYIFYSAPDSDEDDDDRD